MNDLREFLKHMEKADAYQAAFHYVLGYINAANNSKLDIDHLEDINELMHDFKTLLEEKY